VVQVEVANILRGGNGHVIEEDRSAKRERKIEKFKQIFRVSGIVNVRMGSEGFTKVGGELLGLLFIRMGPRGVTSMQRRGNRMVLN
jgi:hypothetical protein